MRVGPLGGIRSTQCDRVLDIERDSFISPSFRTHTHILHTYRRINTCTPEHCATIQYIVMETEKYDYNACVYVQLYKTRPKLDSSCSLWTSIFAIIIPTPMATFLYVHYVYVFRKLLSFHVISNLLRSNTPYPDTVDAVRLLHRWAWAEAWVAQAPLYG